MEVFFQLSYTLPRKISVQNFETEFGWNTSFYFVSKYGFYNFIEIVKLEFGMLQHIVKLEFGMLQHIWFWFGDDVFLHTFGFD